MEADDKKRSEYLEKIKEIDEDKLVYIDESGIDNNISKDYGWSKRGQPIKAKKSGKYYIRTNIVAGLNENKSIAPLVFTGSCNTELFNAWIEQFLIKELKPDQVVIMDNASFHKSTKTRELIESVGCILLYLPPYSPDLNLIEKFWANMKRWIKQRMADFKSLYCCLEQFFKYAMSN